MFELRTYNRTELEEMFHTTRTDSMRRSLSRMGYEYTSAGRGKEYTITITKLATPPSKFEVFAKREFTCGPQTNFVEMETFFSLLMFHPEFRYYPATYQKQFLQEYYNIDISDQTLRNWKKKLLELNWITIDEDDCRYYACRKEKKPSEMEMEKYRKAWKVFYTRVAEGKPPGDARRDIYYQCHGMPRKQRGFIENAIEQEKLGDFKKVLSKSALNMENLR